MNLTPAIEDALHRFALEQNITREEALAMIAEDWLMGPATRRSERWSHSAF